MKSSIVSVVVVGMLTGCQPHVEVKNESVNDLSDFAKKYLRLSNAATVMFNPMQTSMRRSARITRRPPTPWRAVERLTADSVNNGVSTCGIDTLIHNPDGSAVEITDYGDSCVYHYDYAKVVYWGNRTSTYKYTDKKSGSTYVSEYFGYTHFKNFGGRYVSKDFTNTWNSTGSYSILGTSSYDTLLQVHAGSNRSSDSTAFSYNGELYLHLSSAKYTFDDKTHVEQTNDDQYVYGDNFYHSVVTVPVVTDYTCDPYSNGNIPPSSNGNPMPPGISSVIVPVSGHEVVTYKQDGKTGEFEVDYGSGECDTLVTIIEDGNAIIVDMARLYPAMSGG